MNKMKTLIRGLIKSACLALTLMLVTSAQAQYNRFFTTLFTNDGVNTLNLQVTSNMLAASDPSPFTATGIVKTITLRPDYGYSLFGVVVASNAATAGHSYISLGLSPDGTNWPSTVLEPADTDAAATSVRPGVLRFAVTNKVAPGVMFFTNIAPSQLYGYRYMRLFSISNMNAKHLHLTNLGVNAYGPIK